MSSNQLSSQNETASQLFSRLLSQTTNMSTNPTQTDPKLTQFKEVLNLNKPIDLEPTLFPKGVACKEIIELYGKSGTGKSELIMHFISRCLMPPKFKFDLTSGSSLVQITLDLTDESIFGDEKNLNEPSQMPKIILVNTDAKFNVMRLFNIMETRLSKALNNSFKNGINTQHQEVFTSQSKELIEKYMKRFIRECLKNLIVYECFNSEQFIYALAACEYFVQNLIQTKSFNYLMPIFIDTINSNYELTDRYNAYLGLNEFDHTEKYTISLIKRLIEKYSVCIIASRSDYSLTENYSNNVYKKWQQILDKKLEMTLISSKMGNDAKNPDETVDNTILNQRYVNLMDYLDENKTNTSTYFKENQSNNEETKKSFKSSKFIFEIDNLGVKFIS
jgi:hypothetical protein